MLLMRGTVPSATRPSHQRRRRCAVAAGPGRTAPPSSKTAAASSASDEAFAREGWRRDPRFVRVDFSAELAHTFRRRFAELLSPESGGEARARLAEAALVVSAEDDATAAPTTVPFPVASWLARVDRLADGAEAAAAAARGEARRRRQRPGQRRRGEGQDDDGKGGGDDEQEQEQDEEEEEEEERAAFAAVERYLFQEQGFSPGDPPRRQQQQQQQQQQAGQQPSPSSPWWPRSALAPRRRYDHAATAELGGGARRAYLHEALTRKRGTHPAALAVLLADVHARLLQRGATRRPAVVGGGGGGRRWTGAPTARPARRLTRRAVLPADGGGGVDSASAWPLAAFPAFDPLLEMLRHLKRSYWPFMWDTNADADADADPSSSLLLPPRKLSHGGFVGAAKSALGEDEDAALRVVSAAAKHRLERGIFTSPGAGDLRRCLAAAERIVLVLDARTATAADARAHAADLALERRDLGALLLHAGRAEEAAAELGAYAEARRARRASGGGGGPSSRQQQQGAAGGASRLAGVPRPWEAAAVSAGGGDSDSGAGQAGGGDAGHRWDTAFEAALADRLLALALRLSSSPAPPPPLTVERALRSPPPGPGAAAEPQRHTW